MTHNDVLRSLRYLLNVRDDVLVAIARLGGREVTLPEMASYLAKEDEPGYRPCGDELFSRFLNGLVVHLRGKDETRPPQPVEIPVTNNVVLKKLRVAFELTDEDILALLAPTALRVSKSELGAFFRRPDHRNYRPCGDQLVRNLLKRLTDESPWRRAPR